MLFRYQFWIISPRPVLMHKPTTRCLTKSKVVQRLGLLVMHGWSQSDFAMQLLTAPLYWRLPGSAQIRGWTPRVTLAAAATAV